MSAGIALLPFRLVRAGGFALITWLSLYVPSTFAATPVILAAGIIWALIAWQYSQNGLPQTAATALRHTLLEFAELFLFLLAAMTYVNAMDDG